MNRRLHIIRDSWKRAGWTTRERGMAWLSRQLNCSRQALYMVLDGSRRSTDLEAELSRMFPELPAWEGELIPVGKWIGGRF
jgi:hypothetical protein